MQYHEYIFSLFLHMFEVYKGVNQKTKLSKPKWNFKTTIPAEIPKFESCDGEKYLVMRIKPKKHRKCA